MRAERDDRRRGGAAGRQPRRRTKPLPLLLAALALALAGTAAAQPDGAALYDANCASCHGPEGGGGVGPALAGNASLGEAAATVRQILMGGDGMPAFAEQLGNAEIAAVATHIRTSWGNDAGPVEPEIVAQQRGGDEGASEADGSSDPASAETDEAADGAAPDEAAGASSDETAGEAADGEAGAEPAAEPPETDAAASPPDPAGDASLALRVTPADAEVEITGPDGFARTVDGGERVLDGLPAGGYVVTVRTGDGAYRQTLRLHGGARTEAVFELEPAGSDANGEDAP